MTNGGPISRLCVLPELSGIGGMVSFQRRLSAGLAAKGVAVTYDPDDLPYQALLVVGGTRQLGSLLRARRRGIPVVQRLDGRNWLHRRMKTGPRHYLRAEYGNLLLNLIRRRLADRVIYQSRFVAQWWTRSQGAVSKPETVIYNGVDLSHYSPEGPHTRPTDRYRLLLVEGSLRGGYELGLEHAIHLTEALEGRVDRPVELMIAGQVSEAVKTRWENQTPVPLQWMGVVAPAKIPELDRSAHCLFSADLNAACPNAVIEALACGLPVVAFATGALPELLDVGSGRLAGYGGDPWELDPPDIGALADATAAVFADQDHFRSGARQRAADRFGLDRMVESYLRLLGSS